MKLFHLKKKNLEEEDKDREGYDDDNNGDRMMTKKK